MSTHDYEVSSKHWSGGSLTVQTDDRDRVRTQLNNDLDRLFDGELNEVTVRLVKY